MRQLYRILPAPPALLSAAPLLADSRPVGGHWHDMGWGMGGMPFGPIMMLLIWGAIIVFIVLAVRWFSVGTPGGSGQSNRAREILEERFARGEIDKEEFEERRRLLSR